MNNKPAACVCLVYIMLMLFLSTGCWDRREVENLMLSDAIAIDVKTMNDILRYEVTIISTKAGPSGGSQMGMEQESGPQAGIHQWMPTIHASTLEEALHLLTLRSPRYNYFDHNRIILFGEAYARSGISNALDFLIRKKGLRLRNNIIIAKTDIQRLLKAQPEFESTLAEEIVRIMEIGEHQSGYFAMMDLSKFTQDMLSTGIDPWAPVVDTIPVDNTLKKQIQHVIATAGIAVFQDDQLAGYLDPVSAQGLLLLNNRSRTGGYFLHDSGLFSYRYQHAKANKKIKIDGKEVSVQYDLRLSGVLEEVHGITEITPETILQLEADFEHEAVSLIQNTISACQKYKTDPFGIGRAIHIKDRRLWKDLEPAWRDIYPNIPITVNVHVQIIGIEFASKPILPPNRRELPDEN